MLPLRDETYFSYDYGYPQEQILPEKSKSTKKSFHINYFRTSVLLIGLFFVIGYTCVLYTAKCTEVMEKNYQLENLNQELVQLQNENNTLQAQVLEKYSIKQVDQVARADMQMKDPAYTDLHFYEAN